MRAIELMAVDYPELAAFRGQQFDSNERTVAGSWDMGRIEQSLRYALSKPSEGSVDKQTDPSLVMFPYSNIVRSYLSNGLTTFTEGNWTRNILHLGLKNPQSSAVTVYRLHGQGVDIKGALDEYNNNGIDLEEIAG